MGFWLAFAKVRQTLGLTCLLAVFGGCVTFHQSVIDPVKTEPFADGLTPQEVSLQVEDGVTLEGWLFWKDAPRTLLVFHGTGGNLYTYIPYVNPLVASLDVNLFMIDYRGYGRSTGKPDEKGIFADALAAYEYLTVQRKVPPRSLVVYGFSLGGAPALYLAGRKPIGGLIMEGAFTSMPDAARAVAARYGASVEIALESKFDNLSRVGEYRGRLLLMHAKQDVVVPWEQGRKLFEASRSEPKRMITLKGEHCRAWRDDRDTWLAAFTSFLGEVE